MTKKQFSASKNIVVAHRGAFKKNGHPENSVASLKEAIRLGCTGSEFDVRMTADDSLIINHDPHFHDLTIEKTSYADLIKNTLSNGEKLPTLQEYLKAGMQENRHTKLVVEIKPSDISKERGRQVAEKVVKLIKELGAEKMVVYISFDYDILKKINELDKQAITQYLTGDKSPAEVKADGISGIDYHFSVFKQHPDWIRMAKEAGLILNAWTVNEVSDMKWLINESFDLITTNEPEILLNLVSK